MGDRANIKIVESENYGGGEIYFYTHWCGEELHQTLRDALIRGEGRWDDDSYISRIIFSEMIKGDVMDLTGFGISTKLTDNEHPILVVDLNTHEIYAEKANGESQRFTFQEYIDVKVDIRHEEVPTYEDKVMTVEVQKAIRDLIDDFHLGDFIYQVRDSARESGDGYSGDSWEHPRVLRFNEIVQLLQESTSE